MAAKNKQQPHRQSALDLKDWHCLALLTLLAALFFRDILLGTAYFWEDFLYQNYPFRVFAATSMASGQLPFWNPYTFGGMPFLADIQTAVFYLPSVALTLAVHHETLHHFWLELMILLHYPLAGGGMFYLARSFGLRRVSALFSGLAFMLSGFMVAHAIHQQIVTLAAWYPVVLLLFRHLLQDRRWLWVFAGAIVLGHSTLAGFPQLSLYLYALLGVFFLFELFSTYPGKNLFSHDALMMTARAAALVILSLAIAGLQLFPTLELSPFSERAEITYAKSTEGSLSWGQLLTFIFPTYFGTSRAEQYAYWGPGDFWHFWETCVYLGIPTLLLALFTIPQIRRQKYILFFWSLLLVALLYALGGNFPLQKLFFHYVPGFAMFRNPARASLLVSLSAALLAGWGLNHLLDRDPGTQRSRVPQLIGIALGGIAVLIWILTTSGALRSSFFFLTNTRVTATLQHDMPFALAFLSVTGILIFIALRKHPSSLLFALLFPCVQFIDMTWFGGSQPLSSVNPATYFSRSWRIVEPLKREAQEEFFRVSIRTAGGIIMDRNQGMIDRIFTLEGYTPLALKRRQPPIQAGEKAFDLLNVKYRTVRDEGGRISFVRNPTYLPRAFMVYRAYVARNDSDLVQYLNSPEFDHRAIAAFEEDPGITLPTSEIPPTSRATVTGYSNNEITIDVETSAAGVLVLSEISYPGWTSLVDGTPGTVYQVDYCLRGIITPAGHHTVVLRFSPTSFSRGILLTAVALGVCCTGSVVSFRRSRHGKDRKGARA
jgi:hypothetical protein